VSFQVTKHFFEGRSAISEPETYNWWHSYLAQFVCWYYVVMELNFCKILFKKIIIYKFRKNSKQ
jgi:hypothetical protein